MLSPLGGGRSGAPYAPTASSMRLSDILSLTQPAGGAMSMGGAPGQDEPQRLAELLQWLQAGG